MRAIGRLLWLGCSVGAPVVLMATGLGHAGVVFYEADPAGFSAAVIVQSYDLEGTEDFESSSLAANNIDLVDDPLAPGVANPPFPTGTLTVPGVTVQSNTLGGSPTTPSPRGVNALATASAGYFDTPTDQVSNNFQTDSVDLLFAPASGIDVRAMSFAPLFFSDFATSSTSTPGSLEIRVYGPGNTLLGSTTVTGIDYSGTDFLGISATAGDVIVRVNLWDGSTSNHFQGADDIAVYTSTTPVTLSHFVVE